jgi:hypothetical protein
LTVDVAALAVAVPAGAAADVDVTAGAFVAVDAGAVVALLGGFVAVAGDFADAVAVLSALLVPPQPVATTAVAIAATVAITRNLRVQSKLRFMAPSS